MRVLTRIATLEAVLGEHEEVLAGDFEAYRNHTYRVVNLCLAQSPADPEGLEKIAVAAAFHDLGIWTHGTFDYLQPSVSLADAYLRRSGRPEWSPEVAAMIFEHHKISRYQGNRRWLVEPFRRADWADVSRGLIAFGFSRALLREVFSKWPSAGFHKRLVQLELRWVRTHPWRPLPMVKF
jgi:hypothetical protein